MSNELIVEILIGVPSLLAGVFVSPALGRVSSNGSNSSVSLPAIIADAKQLYPPRQKSPSAKKTQGSQSDTDTIIIWAVGVLAVVLLYLKYRQPILIGLLAVASLIAALAAVSIISMSRQRIIANNHGVYLSLLGLFAAFAVGFTLVSLLWDPPFATEEYREFLSSGEGGGLRSVGFVLYQLIGGATYLLVAFTCISFSICVISAINLHISAAGRWIWRRSFRATSWAWSAGTAIACIPFSAISLAMASGWVYSLLEAHTQ